MSADIQFRRSLALHWFEWDMYSRWHAIQWERAFSLIRSSQTSACNHFKRIVKKTPPPRAPFWFQRFRCLREFCCSYKVDPYAHRLRIRDCKVKYAESKTPFKFSGRRSTPGALSNKWPRAFKRIE